MTEREAAAIVREMLEAFERYELELFKGGFRGLSQEIYKTRLDVADALRRFEAWAASEHKRPDNAGSTDK